MKSTKQSTIRQSIDRQTRNYFNRVKTIHCYSLVPNRERAIQTAAIKTAGIHLARKVPDEIKRSRDLRGGRWSWTFNWVSPKEIMSREVELGCESWTSFASSCSSTAVQRTRTLSLWLCPNTAVETSIVQCTSRWARARGHRLNISIVLAAVHGLSGLFPAVSKVEPSLFRPLPPPVPVPNKPLRFCGRKAT